MKQKKSPILGVIIKNEVHFLKSYSKKKVQFFESCSKKVQLFESLNKNQFFESYERKKVQFFVSNSKKKINSLCHVQKEGSTLWDIK